MLDDLVDAQVAANPDGRFKDICDRVVDQVPDDQLRKLLAIALRSKVKRAMGARLASLTHQPGPTYKAPRAVAAARPDDLLRQQVSPRPGRWKSLGSLTIGETEDLAGYHASQFLHHAGLRDTYFRLASAMRRLKAHHLSELGTEAVLAEFDPAGGGPLLSPHRASLGRVAAVGAEEGPPSATDETTKEQP